MRLVDGGYFESWGTVTAHELLVAVQALIGAEDADPAVARLRPFVIHISNEPVPLSPGEPAQASCLQRDHWSEDRQLAGDPKQKVLGEVPPLLAPLNVRPARGFQAREALFVRMGGNGPSARRVHFQLYDLGTGLPLGWVLSNKARMDIRAQLGTGEVSAAAKGGSRRGSSLTGAPGGSRLQPRAHGPGVRLPRCGTTTFRGVAPCWISLARCSTRRRGLGAQSGLSAGSGN